MNVLSMFIVTSFMKFDFDNFWSLRESELILDQA